VGRRHAAPALLAAAIFSIAAGTGASATTERLSVSTTGDQAVSDTTGFSVSRTGRFVAFDSDSYNLVPNDGNTTTDTFLRDRDTDRDGIFDEPGKVKTVRISVSPEGTDQIGASQGETSISAGGRFVAFVSNGFNLVPGDQTLTASIYVRDRDTDRDRIFDEPGAVKTVRLSDPAVYPFSSYSPCISANGRFVAFSSASPDVVADDTNDVDDTFLHDRDTDGNGVYDEPGTVSTVRLSVSSDDMEADFASGAGCFSRNGRYVAFTSVATNLVSGDSNGTGDVFIRDRDTDSDGIFDEPGSVSTFRVSEASDGAEGNGVSFAGGISSSGRFIAFSSDASNLVAGDTNGARDTFVRDRDPDRDGVFDEPGEVSTVRVSSSAVGDEGDWHSSGGSISRTGRFVGFTSSAGNLVPGDTNGHADSFVVDRDSDRNRVFDEPGGTAVFRISLTASGGQIQNAESSGGLLSANGRWGFFTSDAFGIDDPDLALWNRDTYTRGPLR
jgi:hypothetical protein